MPNISKVKLPTGGVYDIKDEEARDALEDLVAVHFAGPYDSVDDLPEGSEADPGCIYLVNSGDDLPNIFDEYIYINLEEPYIRTIVLSNWRPSDLNSYDWEQFPPITIGNFKWYQLYSEYGYMPIPDLDIGDYVNVHFAGWDTRLDVEVSETVTKQLLYDSDENYVYIDLSDINVFDAPDSSLWETGECAPRIILHPDGDEVYVTLAFWGKLGPNWDMISIAWQDIELTSSEDGPVLTVGTTEEVSSTYELVGQKLDINQLATQTDIEDINWTINDIYNELNGKTQILGPYSSVNNLPQWGNTKSLYIVWNGGNKCSAYIYKTGTESGYKLVSPLETLSFDGPYASVSLLPATGDSNKIYLVSVSSSEANNIYEEYLYINNQYELIGTTEMDLSNYALISQLPTVLSDLTDDVGFLQKSGGTMTGTLTLNTATLTADLQAAPKKYVDTKVNGVDTKVNGKVNTFESEITSQGYQLESYIHRMSNSKAVVSISGTRFDTEASTNTNTGNRLLVGYVSIDIQTGTPTSGQQGGLTYTSQISVSPSETVIHNVATPTVSRDAATKQYVDDSISTAITNAISGGY